MPERVMITGPVKVSAPDGTTYVASRDEVPVPCLPDRGDASTTETRWVFVAADGTRHIGPPAAGASHLDSLQELFEAWWRGELGSPR